jgi:hypothetical protein
MPNPTSRNASTPADMSIRFFIMMLATFFARVRPASTSPAQNDDQRLASLRLISTRARGGSAHAISQQPAVGATTVETVVVSDGATDAEQVG